MGKFTRDFLFRGKRDYERIADECDCQGTCKKCGRDIGQKKKKKNIDDKKISRPFSSKYKF